MRINDLLNMAMVLADVEAPSKDVVLEKLAKHICSHGELSTPAEEIHTALMNRERLGSTGVGEGVAIPHAKIPGLASLVGCFARSRAGIAFDAIDQKPVRLIFVLLVPENSAGAHLKALARISRLLRSPEFRHQLLEQPDSAALYDALVAEDARH